MGRVDHERIKKSSLHKVKARLRNLAQSLVPCDPQGWASRRQATLLDCLRPWGPAAVPGGPGGSSGQQDRPERRSPEQPGRSSSEPERSSSEPGHKPGHKRERKPGHKQPEHSKPARSNPCDGCGDGGTDPYGHRNHSNHLPGRSKPGQRNHHRRRQRSHGNHDRPEPSCSHRPRGRCRPPRKRSRCQKPMHDSSDIPPTKQVPYRT